MKRKIAGLVVLSAVPMLAGLTRLFDMPTGRLALDGHERFAADPLTGVLHIVGATGFATIGAFQFMPSRSHRLVGRVLSALGLIAAFAGAVMAMTWAPKQFDTAWFNAMRTTVAIAMVVFIVAGVVTARRGDFTAHAAWMTRAYALFLSAGTQVFTAGFTALPFMQPHMNERLYAASMAAGWVINLVAAEWVIRGYVAGGASTMTSRSTITGLRSRL